jgi:hypothetical protein
MPGEMMGLAMTNRAKIFRASAVLAMLGALAASQHAASAQQRPHGLTIVVKLAHSPVGVASRVVVQNVAYNPTEIRTLPNGRWSFEALACTSNLKFDVVPLDRAAYRGRVAQPVCAQLQNNTFLVEVEANRS